MNGFRSEQNLCVHVWPCAHILEVFRFSSALGKLKKNNNFGKGVYLFIVFILLKHSWLCDALVAKTFLKIPEGSVEEVQLKCKLKTCLELLLLCFCIKRSELRALIGLCSLYILYIILVINVCLISVQKKTVIEGGNRVRTDDIFPVLFSYFSVCQVRGWLYCTNTICS